MCKEAIVNLFVRMRPRLENRFTLKVLDVLDQEYRAFRRGFDSKALLNTIVDAQIDAMAFDMGYRPGFSERLSPLYKCAGGLESTYAGIQPVRFNFYILDVEKKVFQMFLKKHSFDSSLQVKQLVEVETLNTCLAQMSGEWNWRHMIALKVVTIWLFLWNVAIGFIQKAWL